MAHAYKYMIIKKDVEHIAKLARIELTEEEMEKFRKDLGGILNFVGQLNKVDVSGVNPVAGGLVDEAPDLFKNKTEADGRDGVLGDPEQLRNAAPKSKKGRIEVRAVF